MLKDKRVLGFFFIVLALGGGTIIYAATREGTVGHVTVIRWLNATRGIRLNGVEITSWDNITGTGTTYDQDLNTTDAVIFATVDTGQGANELYDMDQNVLQASDVNFSSVEADDYYLKGSTNYTAWIETQIDTAINTVPKHDQDLNTTDDATFENVTASNTLTLNGVSITGWDEVSAIGASLNKTGWDVYCWRSGATYYYLCSNGTLLSSSDFADRWNAIMVENSYEINTYLEPGTYVISDDLYFEGTGGLLTRTPFFWGAGQGETILDVDAGVTCFTLKTGASPNIGHLEIALATTGGVAYGIYGDPTGGAAAYTECGGMYADLHDIKITGGVSGGWGVYLINSEWCRIGAFRIAGSSGFNGMLFVNLATADYSYCENEFYGLTTITQIGDNTIGMMFKGASHDQSCNQMQGVGYFWIRRSTAGAYTNTTGLRMKYCDFFQLGRFHFEKQDCFVNISYSYGGVIEGGKATHQANVVGNTLFDLSGGGNYNLLFQHFHIFSGTLNSVEWVKDTRDSATSYNAFYDITLHCINPGVITQTVTGTTSLELIRSFGSGTVP